MEIFLIPIDNSYDHKNEALETVNKLYKPTVKRTLMHDENFQSQCTTNCPSASSESENEECPKLTSCLKSNWLYRVKVCKSITQNKMKLKMKNLAMSNYNFVTPNLN
jgi:hypothetical protein